MSRPAAGGTCTPLYACGERALREGAARDEGEWQRTSAITPKTDKPVQKYAQHTSMSMAAAAAIATHSNHVSKGSPRLGVYCIGAEND